MRTRTQMYNPHKRRTGENKIIQKSVKYFFPSYRSQKQNDGMKTSPRTFLPSWIQLIKIYLTFPLNILLAIVFNNFLSFFALPCWCAWQRPFTIAHPSRSWCHPAHQVSNLTMEWIYPVVREMRWCIWASHECGYKLKALEQFNLALSYSSIKDIKKMITKHAKAHYSLLPPEMCFIKSMSFISKS